MMFKSIAALCGIALVGLTGCNDQPAKTAEAAVASSAPRAHASCKDAMGFAFTQTGGTYAKGAATVESLVAATQDPTKRIDMIAVVGQEITEDASGIHGSDKQCAAYLTMMKQLGKMFR